MGTNPGDWPETRQVRRRRVWSVETHHAMGLWDSLPSKADLDAQRRAIPKHAMVSRLDDKAAKRKADAKAEDAWRKAVRQRDGMRCRWCRREVVATMALVPERAECHHLTPREHKPTRWDVRNGVLVCKADHDRLTGAVGGEKAIIVAGTTFTIDGRSYPNADGPLNFRRL